jgi:hypothetical protein
MLGVFPGRKARMEEKRGGTRRKTEQSDELPPGWIEFARTRPAPRAIVRARSRVTARLALNRRRVAEGGRLLCPVMFSRKPRFASRFRSITDEFFFAAHWGMTAGSNAGKFAGRKSPAPAGQVIESKQDF